MESPVPFITTTAEGRGFSVNQEALDLLRQPRFADKRVVVVSIVGKCRQGKSFLMNALVGRTDGFPLGSAVVAQTKGVWMWMREHPDDPTKVLVFLDTEGLADVERNDTIRDIQLFALVTLLSSVMIYNTKDTIDSNSLEVLHLATELTECIRVRSKSVQDDEDVHEGYMDEISRFFPTLVWAVRDQFLEMKAEGSVLTPEEYLERCLMLKHGHKKSVLAHNQTVDTIRNSFRIETVFRRRKCFLFSMPAETDQLTRLHNIDEDMLDESFRSSVGELKSFILSEAPCKSVEEKDINGNAFSRMVEKYSEAVSKENRSAVNESMRIYHEKLTALELPVATPRLNEANSAAQQRAIKAFLQAAISGRELNYGGYFDVLRRQLCEDFAARTKENYEKSLVDCTELLESLYDKVNYEMASGKFVRPGGSHELKVLLDKLRAEYAVEAGEKGPAGEDALAKFEESTIRPALESVVMADSALEMEGRRQRVREEEARLERKREQMLDSQMQELQALNDHVRDVQVKCMEQKMQAQVRVTSQFRDQVREECKATYQEKEHLLKLGFKEKAEILQAKLDDAMEEMKKTSEYSIQEQERLKNEMKLMEERMKQASETASTQLTESRRSRVASGTFEILGRALGKAVDFVVPMIGPTPNAIVGIATSISSLALDE